MKNQTKKLLTFLLTTLIFINGCCFNIQNVRADNNLVPVTNLKNQIATKLTEIAITTSVVTDYIGTALMEGLATNSLIQGINYWLTIDDVSDAIDYYYDLNDTALELTYNGGNKNYYYDYTDNDYKTNYNYSTNNYNTINYNKTDNNYDVTYNYNNQTYNYNDIDINNTYIDVTNNNYYFNYDITNNYYISISNTYNNTTIINNGTTQKLYYQLPDGTSSYNLTEELAKKGYKTSLNVSSYNNISTNSDLLGLWHFDNNEKDSSKNNNLTLSISNNSIQYTNDENDFNTALTFQGDTTISTSTSGKAFSFRIKPTINDNFQIKINNTSLGTIKKEYIVNTTSTNFLNTNYTKNTVSRTINLKKTIINNITYYCASSYYFYTLDYIKENPMLHFRTDEYIDNETFLTIINTEVDDTEHTTSTYYLNNVLYNNTINYKVADQSNAMTYYGYIINSSTTNSTYNYINNSYYENTGNSTYLNADMWNYIYVDTLGYLYINGNDTNTQLTNNQVKIEIISNGITAIDELAIFNSNKSTISPQLPYTSNIAYTLPNSIKNNSLLLQTTLTINTAKFGGIRQGNPTTGDVYIDVDDYGYIQTLEIFDGTDWIEVKGSIYNEYLNLWITAIGFNILNDNWEIVEEQYNVSDKDGNTFIRFFTNSYEKIIQAINNIKVELNIVDEESDISDEISNEYDIDIDVDIPDIITNIENSKSGIGSLSGTDYNIPNSHKTNIQLLSTNIINPLVETLEENDLGILIYGPIIVWIVGLLL